MIYDPNDVLLLELSRRVANLEPRVSRLESSAPKPSLHISWWGWLMRWLTGE